MYTPLVSGLLFPLHERLKGHSSTALRRELERTQWLAPAALEPHVEQRLGAFLQHAAAHVPYYRDLFAARRFVPASRMPLRALADLPFLDKPAIRANGERLRADDAGPMKLYNTGGSSGEPLRFWIDRHRVSHDVAAKWRATRWWGVDIGDPEVVVWGSPIEVGAQDRVRRWRDLVLRTHLLSAFDLGEESLHRYVAEIVRLRPRMLFGYASALARIAAHARDRGVPVHALGIRVAFVTSEQLFPDQRQIISEVFGCPVANGYGGRDFGFVAHECPEGRLHQSAEHILVETVGPDGAEVPPGEAGEIVVTHLATPGFPFIRYRTGDVGVREATACPCGRGLPVLREVRGRTTDFLTAASGASVHALALIYVIRDLPGVRKFRIVQEALNDLRLLVVRDPDFEPSVLPEVERQFRARLGAGLQVRVEFVDDIPALSSGKHRYVINRLAG
jgi:phenylacetate-CoA ligase